ncbi:non-canonical purine NTP diphosphatase [Bacteroidales bacterium OttesenSCG-928-B11]|nr:non-canonical purine NTP diphosphatase [Bacteroidales bacterium OttesenSCG-928-E04]MDL2309181.1 non-canonical purine NTP diphosphatase [Bacteroidales bacterium OttesenSCG-928-C03]MDL2312057.1 non-canonical purine NTP diphosphatase [Bacteroidales bacterium OttesenSCG-928-B11]
MNIIFATHNQHKTEEVRQIAGNKFTILNLHDIGCRDDIPETADTLQGNALQKAQYVVDKFGIDCFADDTGLEIEALNGAPGVYSARYAGAACNFQDNLEKVLREMEGVENRRACFKTVIALILNGKQHFFEGRIDGIITAAPRGTNGFGYDPIFQPDGYEKTFAQMTDDEKNKISHRGIATEKLMALMTNI